jgi:hypothetical protein
LNPFALVMGEGDRGGFGLDGAAGVNRRTSSFEARSGAGLVVEGGETEGADAFGANSKLFSRFLSILIGFDQNVFFLELLSQVRFGTRPQEEQACAPWTLKL